MDDDLTLVLDLALAYLVDADVENTAFVDVLLESVSVCITDLKKLD